MIEFNHFPAKLQDKAFKERVEANPTIEKVPREIISLQKLCHKLLQKISVVESYVENTPESELSEITSIFMHIMAF